MHWLASDPTSNSAVQCQASTLTERAPFGICRCSLKRDRFEFVNRALREMLGYPEEALLAASLSNHIFAKATNWDELIDLLKRDRRLHAQETYMQRADQSTVRVRLTAYLQTNQLGEPDEVEAYVEDLTEQSALEQQIRSVQRLEAVGRLAGGIAHDFNNILVVIQLSTELMLGQVTPDSPLARSLLQVAKAADRAAALTKQMLAFSRRQVMQPRVVNINAVVNDTLHMLRRIIGEDIQLVTHLAESLANATLDPDQLSQVVFNLAVNARDAMPQGGVLHLETSNVELGSDYAQEHPPVQPGRYVMLAVTDTGTGIASTDLPRIFDPFFTTKEIGKGTGLGLSIVYGIVKQSGGYIWVYSEPGLGTTFKLYFPVTDRKSEKAPPRQETGARPDGEVVLVVEDDAVIRSSVCKCLEHLGYKVLEAESGEAGLKVCRENPGHVDLVLTDLVMPGMSGGGLAAALQKEFPQLQVLFTSGYTPDVSVRRELLRDQNSFLEKPYTVAVLATAVRDALAKKSMRRGSS